MATRGSHPNQRPKPFRKRRNCLAGGVKDHQFVAKEAGEYICPRCRERLTYGPTPAQEYHVLLGG